jgi:hypothetical protein
MVCFGFGRAHNTKPVLQGDNLEFIIGFLDREVVTTNDQQFVKMKIESE